MLYNAAFHLGLHCLPKYPFRFSGPQKVKDHLLPALFSPSAIGLQRTDGKLRFCISLFFRRFLYALYCCPVIFKIIIISNDSRKDADTRDLTNKRRA